MITQSELSQFTGTDNWYRHALVKNFLYTDGVQYLAENAQCYWLLDKISAVQSLPHFKRESFQVWTMTVHEDKTAHIICDDGNDNVIDDERLDYTDFQLPSIKLYAVKSGADTILMLPSEY